MSLLLRSCTKTNHAHFVIRSFFSALLTELNHTTGREQSAQFLWISLLLALLNFYFPVSFMLYAVETGSMVCILNPAPPGLPKWFIFKESCVCCSSLYCFLCFTKTRERLTFKMLCWWNITNVWASWAVGGSVSSLLHSSSQFFQTDFI